MDKPLVYAPIPEFDQQTHYVMQLPPAEHADHVFIGVEVKKLPAEVLQGGEMFVPVTQ